MRRIRLLCRCYLLLLLFAAIVQSARSAAADTLSSSSYDVPLFELNDLSSGRRLDELATVLGTTGLLAIRVVKDVDPDFERLRESALGGLCDCIVSNSDSSENNAHFLSVEGTDTAKLSDGLTTRTTFATATMGNMPLPLPSSLKEACGIDTVQGMEALRDRVAFVSNAFVSALDHLLLQTNSNMHTPLLRTIQGGTYFSVSSIVKASSNLEHFHVYSKTIDEHLHESSAVIDEALDLHTDAGLFLTFVPGLACHTDRSNADDSFHVADTDGVTKRAVFPQGSVGIMLGTGSEHWLTQSRPLRATRHAVRMRQGVKRAWYGIMHLVPPSAIVQESPQRGTFGDMRKAMVMTSENQRRFGDDPQANVDMIIGCGNDYSQQQLLLDQNNDAGPQRTRARLQQVADASVCNNSTNFYCWMSCLDIPDADNAEGFINEGYSLYCLDPSILASSGNHHLVSKATDPCNKGSIIGGAMNTACTGSWEKTAPGVPSQHVHIKTSASVTSEGDGEDEEEPFCYGGTTMYMDGFQWSGTTCIIYLFPKWVLSTAGNVVVASLGTLIFGMALEGVIYSRRRIVQSMPHGWNRLGVSTLIYGIQLTMGYLIMLVVMTYSGPLFVSVILGLMGGHVIFNAQDAMKKRKRKNSEEALTDESTPFGMSNSDAEEEQDNSMGARSRSSTGYGVPEGSTPCCQNTL